MAQSGLDFVEVGQHYVFAKTVGETDVTLFAGITGDFSDTHVNDQYMKEKSSIGRRIAHGALLVGYMSTVSTISIAHVIHKEGLTDFPVSAGYDRVPIPAAGIARRHHHRALHGGCGRQGARTKHRQGQGGQPARRDRRGRRSHHALGEETFNRQPLMGLVQ